MNDRPRIFRATLLLADGHRRSVLVKAPYYERDPHDSIYGLTARLDELVLEGRLSGYSIRVPATITPRQRIRLVRWPEAIGKVVT